MQLETERLLLRRPQARDLDAYAELFADPEVVRYTGGVTKMRAESEQAVQRMIDHWEDHGIGLFSVVRKEDDRVLGQLRLRRLVSLIQRGNDASVRVAEKLGETLEREDLPGPFRGPTDLYALTLETPAR
jgi:RimJ/RimL family protein N-acetyltransferase